MTEQIIIVDDLYDIAHQYHKGFFENQCVITDETVGKISQIIGNPIEIISATNETGVFLVLLHILNVIGLL